MKYADIENKRPADNGFDPFTHEVYGELFGYPHCCTEEFLTRFFKTYKELLDEQEAVNGEEWVGTGFVPCMSCREKIKATGLNAFVAEFIKPRRLHPKPFPKA